MAFVKCTWINSIVIVSAKNWKLIYWYNFINAKNLFKMLIRILKVKYTKFKFPYFTIDLSAERPSVRPGSTMARALVFSQIKSNHVRFTKLFQRMFILCAMVLPFILY